MASFALYMANRTLAVRNALVEQYTPLLKAVVASISKGRIRRGEDNYVCVGDLESAGVVGLIRGVEQFDPLRGLQPQTYLSAKIRSAVLDELRRLDPLSRADRKLAATDVADPARLRKINRGLSLGAAAPITEAHREELEAPQTPDSVKEVLRDTFKGMSLRECYAIILHRFEGAPTTWVHAALVGNPVATDVVGGGTRRILKIPERMQNPLSENLPKQGRYREHGATKARILRTLLSGRKGQGRADRSVREGA